MPSPFSLVNGYRPREEGPWGERRESSICRWENRGSTQRTTVIVQCAWWSTYSETDPRTVPTICPRPLVPTTRAEAPSLTSANTGPGTPYTVLPFVGTAGCFLSTALRALPTTDKAPSSSRPDVKPYPGSPLKTVTTCKIEPVRAAWSPAYSSAFNEQGDPSTPTTTRTSPGAGAFGCADGGVVSSVMGVVPWNPTNGRSTH